MAEIVLLEGPNGPIGAKGDASGNLKVTGTLTAVIDESTLATAAKQDTGNTSIASLDTKQPAKGTAAMAGSIPVTIATDDAQVTAIKNSVAAIPAKGTAVMAGSTPVTIATDDDVALDIDAIETSTGTTATNTGNIPAKGVAASAGSTPVVTASDDANLAPLAGSTTPFQVALGANAVMATHAAKRFVRVCALVGNLKPAYINPDGAGAASASVGDELNPGDTKDYPVTNSNKLYSFGTAPDLLNVTVF